jgi:hypothetical protein
MPDFKAFLAGKAGGKSPAMGAMPPPMESDMGMEAPPEVSPELEAAMSDFIEAIHAKDAKGAALAFMSADTINDSLSGEPPSGEPEGDEGGQFPPS